MSVIRVDMVRPASTHDESVAEHMNTEQGGEFGTHYKAARLSRCEADEEGRCDIPRVFFSLESTEFLHTAGVNCLCAPKAHFPIHAHIPGLEETTME